MGFSFILNIEGDKGYLHRTQSPWYRSYSHQQTFSPFKFSAETLPFPFSYCRRLRFLP